MVETMPGHEPSTDAFSESARAFLKAESPLGRLRALRGTQPGFEKKMWRGLDTILNKSLRRNRKASSSGPTSRQLGCQPRCPSSTPSLSAGKTATTKKQVLYYC